MANEILTAIVPIGPSHLANNSIKLWAEEANIFRDSLKIVLIEDYPPSEDLSQTFDNAHENLLNHEVVRGHFGSPGQARNMGLIHASSPWICFWDSDDVPRISILLELIEEAEGKSSEIVIGNFTKNNLTINLFDKKSSLSSTLEQISQEPGIWRMAFRKELLSNKSFTNLKMAEDQIFLLILDLPSRKILLSNKIVYEYSTGSDLQLTSSSTAVSDLGKALRFIKYLVKSGGIERNSFSLNVIVKLLFSSIFRNATSLRIQALGDYLKLLIMLKGSRIQVLRSTYLVIRTWISKH